MAKKKPKAKQGKDPKADRKRAPAATGKQRPLHHSDQTDGDEQPLFDSADELSEPSFPIVAVGASAGGLEAFSQLLGPIPNDTGMAIVLVQHLAPKNASLLPELLAAHAQIPVRQVTEDTLIEPDHVYVIPPDASMTARRGRLHLTRRPTDHSQHTPIDTFFCSIAEYAQSRAIGVILSGTATDGVTGIKAIKAAGGIVFAQHPRSARFDGMPRAAIATEVVDLVLDAGEIAAELVRIARHPYLRRGRVRAAGEELQVSDKNLQRIFEILRKSSGVDFTHYKLPTIRRRLNRRMVLNKITSIEHYVKYLEENAGEVQSLYQDILIHVTRFFREPESFETLKSQVFPKILAQRKSETPLRIWVPGCSTGEEPYSLAISLLEYLADKNTSIPIQIFATDLSESAIERARAGFYPDSISLDVSEERRRRFFTRTDGNYQINKGVRDLCVFARQDLTRDPPFSKLDLIVCRNVLIYLGAVLQKKLIALFHYALRPSGFLLLGHAETVGIHADLFALADKKQRIFTKKTVDTSPAVILPLEHKVPQIAQAKKVQSPSEARAGAVQGEANRLLLDKYTPPGVIVDSGLQIIQFRGATGPFLEPAPGDASLHLLKMARDGLIYGLRTALRAARTSNGAIRREGLRVQHNSSEVEVDLEVIPLGPQGDDRHYLILFQNVSRRSSVPAANKTNKKRKGPEPDFEMDNQRLQQELAASREYLQSIIQDLEASNEELQSANEEILSSNEELQSTNEELDTAKEELQSTNEELNTLNEELHGRNEELSRVNSDLINLLGNVQIAIVMVSRDLRIRRFTPMAEKILNLIPTDVGRPIGHIKPNIDVSNLEALITGVIDTMAIADREVQDRHGHWYALRVRPYKNVENRIDGAVLALVDIHTSKQHAEQFAEASAYAESLLDAIHEPVMLLDLSLHVRAVNRAYEKTFGWLDGKLGVALENFHGGVWNRPGIRELLERLLAEKGAIDDHRVTVELPALGRRELSVSARCFSHSSGQESILVAIEKLEPSLID